MTLARLLACALVLAAGCGADKPQEPAASAASATVEAAPAEFAGTVLPNAAIKQLTEVPAKDPKALVAAAVAHKGGLEALENIASVTSVSVHSDPVETRVEVSLIYPDKIRVDYYTGATLDRGLVIHESTGYEIRRGSRTALPSDSVADLKKAVLGEVLPLLVAASKADAELTYLGETEVNGEKADAVKVNVPEVGEVIIFVAIADGAFLGEQLQLRAGIQTVLASDYKTVDGVNIAHKTKVLVGSQTVVATLQSVSINPPLDADVFDPLEHPLSE